MTIKSRSKNERKFFKVQNGAGIRVEGEDGEKRGVTYEEKINPVLVHFVQLIMNITGFDDLPISVGLCFGLCPVSRVRDEIRGVWGYDRYAA
jgi:hypothetical protein